MKRHFFCGAILLSVILFPGCYGSFALTKNLYDWNGAFCDRWSREGTFIALQVLPLYGVTIVGDVVAANLWEFWTGRTVIAPDASSRTAIINGGERQAVLSFSSRKRRLRIDIFDRYRPRNCIVIEPQTSGSTCAREKGKVILSARTLVDGSILIEDPQGNGIHRYASGR